MDAPTKATPAVGIDLGTTHSLIAVFQAQGPKLIPNAHGEFLTPSVVGFFQGHIEVGAAAKARMVSQPEDTAAFFKRSMGTDRQFKLGNHAYRAEEISAMVLRSLKEDAKAYLGQDIVDVVVSVPAYFNEPQRKAVRHACTLAGLSARRLINEPTAAALAYGIHEREDESTFLVYDLGGGTFDVSVMELFDGVMEVRSSAGDAYIGGEDFTRTLAKDLQSRAKIENPSAQQWSALYELAEQAKRSLSTQRSVKVQGSAEHTPIDTEITREHFESINASNIERLRRPVELAVYDAGVSMSDLSRVVLVGGATSMPLVRSLIASQFRLLAQATQNPDHVVALGAAVQAGLLAKDAALDDIVMTDVSAFTLGVDVVKEVDGRVVEGFFSPIIERNTVVPVSREEQFQTAHLGQTEVRFNIFQGEAPFVRSNVRLGSVKVNVPKNKEAHELVTCRFTYDASGLLEVEARVESTQKTARAVIKKLAHELDDQQVQKRLEHMKTLKVHPRDTAPVRRVMARLEQAYALARQRDREIISDMLVRFKTEVDKQDPRGIEKLSKEISKALDEFERSRGFSS